MLRRITAIALAGAAALTFIGPADAARGGNGGNKGGGNTSESSGSISLDQVAPVHGQTVTFTVVSSNDRPFSDVKCYQNGVMVYMSNAGHFDDYVRMFGEPAHTLASLSWPSGDADCNADVRYQTRNGRWRIESSTSFRVSG